MSKQRKKKAASMAQQQQRELAWLMYITAGYLGNLHHARAVNCVTLTDSQLELLDALIGQTESMYDDVSAAMQEIEA